MMQLLPIQLAENGVLIPLDYFGDERDLEIVVQDNFAYIRPKAKVKRQPRLPGSAIGQITISPDFFEPLPDELLDLFEA